MRTMESFPLEGGRAGMGVFAPSVQVGLSRRGLQRQSVNVAGLTLTPSPLPSREREGAWA